MHVDQIETAFFDVLDDLRDYLPDLTLVGGWMPYIYANFLWQISVKRPVTTADIDFGVDQSVAGDYSKTIFKTLSSIGYKERHLKIGKSYPVVLHKEQIPIEFITYPAVDITAVENMVGRQVEISRIDKFDFLLNHRIPVTVSAKGKNKLYTVHCPKPSAFLYHKGATFIDREDNEKKAKDLYYIYFILRYAPDVNEILKEVAGYNGRGCLTGVAENINSYFERVTGQGCLLVEDENGEDEYIHDVRQDIFNRFKGLKKVLQP